MNRTHKTRLVPEVLQTSLMDCGPAALQAVLRGYAIEVDYEALRKRCETDVDGTSLYDLAKLGCELGLDASQVLVPRDTLLLEAAECLPAIVITSPSEDALHFVVVWSTRGRFVQVMDPSTGRRWQRARSFLASLPDLSVSISTARFARWRKTRFASEPLHRRIVQLGLRSGDAQQLVQDACGARDHRPYARLDATARMVERLIEGSACKRGAESRRAFRSILVGAETTGIPKTFWWVTGGTELGTLTLRGAPIVRIAGMACAQPAAGTRSEPVEQRAKSRVVAARLRASSPAAPASDLGAPFQGGQGLQARGPLGFLWSLLRVSLPSAPGLMVMLVALGAVVAVADVLMLQGVLHVTAHLTLPYQRLLGIVSLLSLSVVGLAVEWALSRSAAGLGRSLELQVRGALFECLPQLPDDYLRTRSTADMAQRGHALHLLRRVPELARRALEAGASLLTSSACIAFLYPEAAYWVAGAALVLPLLAWLGNTAAMEPSLRANAHLVALDGFYLDALTGVVPIRVHGAERAVRREHELRLVDWLRAAVSAHTHTSLVQGAQMLVATVLGIWLVSSYLEAQRPLSGVLLLMYWAWRLPAAGAALVQSLVAYRTLRQTVLRFVSPLGSSERRASRSRADLRQRARAGVKIELRNVSVELSKRSLLSDVSLRIEPMEHVAIVGCSGAGKSSLLSLLLGWLAPTRGELRVDNMPLDKHALDDLRAQTAWIDPSLQIWNDTLLANLLYGSNADAIEHLSEVMCATELDEVLERLPEGLQAQLGEGGTRVSGGQGQRVRLTRAAMRQDARLVLLDEPFRGLDRAMRGRLLQQIRAKASAATLLFVSHDIRDTQTFDRVVVVEAGRVVEDGPPLQLLSKYRSRYSALTRADAQQVQRTWGGSQWRRVRMASGRLSESP